MMRPADYVIDRSVPTRRPFSRGEVGAWCAILGAFAGYVLGVATCAAGAAYAVWGGP